MKAPATAIDPTEHRNKPLWCVWGVSIHWPQLLCCKITGDMVPTIWGYSVWKRQPGFRTLGIALAQWQASHAVCHFFAEQQHALDYLKLITTPKIKD